MKYQLTNATAKTSAKGTNYTQVSLTDEQGVVYDRINLFKGENVGKTEIEGTLIKNGDFWNFEGLVIHTANFPGKGAGIAVAMARKEESISNFQDNKEKSIQLAGSITNATNLVVAEMNAGILDLKTDDAVRTEVRNKIIWFKTLYENPGAINPSSSDVPF